MLRTLVELAASAFEAAGTFAMTVGALVALVSAIRDRAGDRGAVFRGFRYRLGRAIILGLELLVAADILRTISTEPTLNQVVILGIVVFIRTFLSFSLEVELEGCWPWQVHAARSEDPGSHADREPHPPAESEATP